MYHPTFEEIERMKLFVEEMSYYFKESFSPYSRSLVRNVVYIESSSTYEESSGLAIFQDWNGFFFSVDFGHCVSVPDGNYEPQQITEDMAIASMVEMDDILKQC